MALANIDATDVVARSAETVVLPEVAVEGLSSPQINVMKSTVVAVETNMAVAGAALRSSAFELHNLKGLIPKRTWTKFINSGALAVSPKFAQDLANSWEFIRDMGLSNGDLVYISTRALNRIANANPEAQQEAAKRLKAGRPISESTARELATAVSGSDLSDSVKKKVKENLTASQKLKSKDEEIAKLKETIEKQKREIQKLKKSSNMQIQTVMTKIRTSLAKEAQEEVAVEA